MSRGPYIPPDQIPLSPAGGARRPSGRAADRGDGALGLVVDELNHRLRNLLTTIEAIVLHTQAATVEEFRAAVMARIAGLYGGHELLDRADGRAVRLVELVERTLRPCGAASESRVHAAGPAVDLRPKLALALHLVLHELATNAAKHGALSAPSGWVKIRWDLLRRNSPSHPPAGRRLGIVWSEHGGPDVQAPQRVGFGTRLMARALTRETPGHVEMTFRPTGLVCRIVVELDSPPAAESRGEEDAHSDSASSLN